MIDLHCHILPGLDDGAKDVETALSMCAMALSDGINAIVATPHDLNGVYANGKEKVMHTVESFKAELVNSNISIEIIPGADVHLAPELIDGMHNVATINNTGMFMLLELPHHFDRMFVLQSIFGLKTRGITPIITHPERNPTLAGDLNILYDFIIAGALSQITAGSITGRFGKDARRAAHLLMEHHMAHIIATDAHNCDSRLPILSSALMEAEKTCGRADARALVQDNPSAIVRGIAPSIKEPQKIKKRGFFSFFH